MGKLTNAQKGELLKEAIENGASVEIVFTEESTREGLWGAIEWFESENGVKISESEIEEIIASIPSKIGSYAVDAESDYFWKQCEQAHFVASVM